MYFLFNLLKNGLINNFALSAYSTEIGNSHFQ